MGYLLPLLIIAFNHTNNRLVLYLSVLTDTSINVILDMVITYYEEDIKKTCFQVVKQFVSHICDTLIYTRTLAKEQKTKSVYFFTNNYVSVLPICFNKSTCNTLLHIARVATTSQLIRWVVIFTYLSLLF